MKTKAKFDFIEFVRPGGFWPYPYTLEQALGVFRWMLKTGGPYQDRGQWGIHDIKSLLSCKPTCVNFSEVEPLTSAADLERRFHWALLSNCVGPRLREWRTEFGVTPGGSRTIGFKHAVPFNDEVSEAKRQEAFDALLNASGRLGTQLNEFHSRAREILGVKLHCRSTYSFILNYGYQGSVWYHCLARQLPQETFWTAFARAQNKLHDLVDGKPVKEAS